MCDRDNFEERNPGDHSKVSFDMSIRDGYEGLGVVSFGQATMKLMVPGEKQITGKTRGDVSFRFQQCSPCLTTGEKIGKSAGNVIWLDENLTILFELYKVHPPLYRKRSPKLIDPSSL